MMTSVFSVPAARRGSANRQAIPELAIVRLTRDVDVDGRILPRASAGTVVGVYAGAWGYEVEFARPFHAVVTLDFADLAE